jgi:Ribbon-helix-helix protein, copG family
MRVISYVYIIARCEMRMLVDLPDAELEQLNVLSKARRVSRAELIRQAVAGYLEQNKAGLEDSFGLWKKKAVDGVKYQERLRGEWER